MVVVAFPNWQHPPAFGVGVDFRKDQVYVFWGNTDTQHFPVLGSPCSLQLSYGVHGSLEFGQFSQNDVLPQINWDINTGNTPRIAYIILVVNLEFCTRTDIMEWYLMSVQSVAWGKEVVHLSPLIPVTIPL